MTNTQERIEAYRSRLQNPWDEEVTAVTRDLLKDEKRWSKKLADDHLTYCLGQVHRFIQTL